MPLFSTFVENEDDESTNVILTVSVVLMAALTVVAVIAAPLIFGLYSVNVSDGVDPDLYRSVGTTLARIFLIQILFYGLVGLANAFLNSRRRFFAAAWSPILPNVIIIAFLLSLPNPGSADWELADVLSDDRLRYTLGLGATVGIASMSIVLLPAMWRTGFRFRPSFDFRHPAVRKLLSLSFWTLGFVDRQPDRTAHRPQPRRTRLQRRQRLHQCLHVLRAARTACWRCRSPPRSSPRCHDRWPAGTVRASPTRRRSGCG